MEIGTDTVAATGRVVAAARGSAAFIGVVAACAALAFNFGRIFADEITVEGSRLAAVLHVVVAVTVATWALAVAVRTVGIAAARVAACAAVFGIDLFIDACTVTDLKSGGACVGLTRSAHTCFVIFTGMSACAAVIMGSLLIDACALAFLESLGTDAVIFVTICLADAVFARAVAAFVATDDEACFAFELDALVGIIGTAGCGKKNSREGGGLYIRGSFQCHDMIPKKMLYGCCLMSYRS